MLFTVVHGVKPLMCRKSRVCRAWKELAPEAGTQLLHETEAIGNTSAFTPQNMVNEHTLTDEELNVLEGTTASSGNTILS